MADSNNTPVSFAPPPASDSERLVDMLIAKHRATIDQVKKMDSEGQMEVFRKLGVDPKALEDHYHEIDRKDAQLKRQDREADKKVSATGWVSFFGGAAAMFGVTKKFRTDSPLVRWSMVGLAAPATAIAGSFVASRVFAGKIRDESKELSIEARKAFERELAVALENHEIDARAALASAQALASGAAATVPKREPGFAAQLVADKASAPGVPSRA